MKVLLIEPALGSKIVPVALLKFAAYHKKQGDSVKLVRVEKDGYPDVGHFDIAYVTSLFTWKWKEVWEAVKYAKIHSDYVKLGGIYATLLPEHAEQSGADEIVGGYIPEMEEIRPAYELVPDCDYSVIQLTRGCIRKCDFCAVWRMEGNHVVERDPSVIRKLIYPLHQKIIFNDNNILASKNWDKIYLELRRLNKKVDLNQGLDARLLNEKKAKQVSKLRLTADKHISVRLAYDNIHYKKYAERAAKLLKNCGINPKRIMYYCLYNFKDTPDDFYERVTEILSWGCVAYPMRYQSIHPPHCFEFNSYVGKHWTKEDLETVKQFIFKFGRGTALPPSLYEHFERAGDFQSAFYAKTISNVHTLCEYGVVI